MNFNLCRAIATNYVNYAINYLSKENAYKNSLPFNTIGKPTCHFKKGLFKQRLRLSLFEIVGSKCEYCFKHVPFEELTIDHIYPRHDGGANRFSNSVLCCRECNNYKACSGILWCLLKKPNSNWGVFK